MTYMNIKHRGLTGYEPGQRVPFYCFSYTLYLFVLFSSSKYLLLLLHPPARVPPLRRSARLQADSSSSTSSRSHPASIKNVMTLVTFTMPKVPKLDAHNVNRT